MRVRVSENACCSIHLWIIEHSNYNHTTLILGDVAGYAEPRVLFWRQRRQINASSKHGSTTIRQVVGDKSASSGSAPDD